MMAAGEEAATAFVETSLGTRLAVSFPAANTTVADLKRIVSDEHAASFPRTGRIAVESFKVKRRGSWYHLTDSVPVRAAFHGVRGAWHLHAHVLPHSECSGGDVQMLHHVLCSQQDATGDSAGSAQRPDAPSADWGDGHARLGDAHEDGYSPVRGHGVIEDPRGVKRSREKQDGDPDHHSVLVGGSLAALVCSVRQDGQNECRHNSMSKRICAAREDRLLDANTVGDIAAHSKGLEEEGALDEGLEKEEEAVSTKPSDLAEPPVELCDHEAKPITSDEDPKLCFSEHENDLAAATEKHADEGMTQEKLAEQQDHIHTSGAEVIQQDYNSKDTSAIHSEHVSDCHQHEGSSRSFDLKCCKNSKCEMLTDQIADRDHVCSDSEMAPQEKENDQSDTLMHALDDWCCHDEGLEKEEEAVLIRPSDLAEPPVELCDHEAKPITNDEDPKLCFSVNENDLVATTEKHADDGMKQDKLAEQQDHLQTSVAEVILQNCNSKDTLAIHSEHVSYCHQHEGSSRSFDLKCCKSSKCEMLTDQIADRDHVCLDGEMAPQEKENDQSDPLLHDLDDSARSLGEKAICGQKEPSVAEVCNSASSKKGKDLPPCGETLKEVNSSEKEAMARNLKGKEPWMSKVCNGERSSSKGTDHPPCAGSMREGNYSEKEGVAHGKNQSKKTVTLVDVDGTKWQVELDGSFELVKQESSSFSWSEKEDTEEIQSGLAKPRQNTKECPEAAPENGGTRVPTERSDLPRHGSFRTSTSNGPTESKLAGGTSAEGAEQGAWERTRRPRAAVLKIPNSRAAKMYGYR